MKLIHGFISVFTLFSFTNAQSSLYPVIRGFGPQHRRIRISSHLPNQFRGHTAGTFASSGAGLGGAFASSGFVGGSTRTQPRFRHVQVQRSFGGVQPVITLRRQPAQRPLHTSVSRPKAVQTVPQYPVSMDRGVGTLPGALSTGGLSLGSLTAGNMLFDKMDTPDPMDTPDYVIAPRGMGIHEADMLRRMTDSDRVIMV